MSGSPDDLSALWNAVLTPAEREARAASGRRPRIPMGRHPALLVVDVTYDFSGDPGETLLESIKKFRMSCGPAAWVAMPRIAELLEGFRSRRLPVIYTVPIPRANPLTDTHWSDAGDGKPRSQESIVRGNRIPEQVAPGPKDLVLEKTKPSAFFGTPLVSYLVEAGVDHLVVSGSTTSGCVRATVVDAHSHSYGVTVVGDAVFDRTDTSHRINLFDMDAKYADVVSARVALAQLEAAVPIAGSRGAPTRPPV